MSGRNPAPWILALTVALAAVTFLVVNANTDDVSGRTPGTAAMIVIGVGIAVLVLVQRGWSARARRRAALDMVHAARGAAAAGTGTDPSRLDPNALFAVLAIHPVDEQALVAGGDRGWAIAERSQRSATAMTRMWCSSRAWRARECSPRSWVRPCCAGSATGARSR